MLVIKVPFERGGGRKSRGASLGPDAIEKQFRKYPWRINGEGADASKNVRFVQSGLLERYISVSIRSLQYTLVVLSGDNSCSEWTVRETASVFPNPNLVVFDAHFDACDETHDQHAQWVRRLWEDEIVAPKQTLFFGARDAEAEEARFVKENDAAIVPTEEIEYRSPREIVHSFLIRGRLNAKAPLVFVVDIDVLDPAFAPGTGVLRAGGLQTRHIINYIKAFGEVSFPVKIGEISEVIPEEGNRLRLDDDKRPDPAGLTVLAAEALLREMLRSFYRSRMSL